RSPRPGRGLAGPSCLRERLIEVLEDVVDVLDAHREAHKIGGDAGRKLLGFGELRVRRRGGVDDEAARVADVREEAEELDAVDEPLAGLEAALDAKGDEAASLAAE